MVKVRTKFPIGAIFSIFFYILTVFLDIWSKIDPVPKLLLAAALIALFLSDFEKEEEKKEGSENDISS